MYEDITQSGEVVRNSCNELMDISFRQEELLANLVKIMSGVEGTEKILSALDICSNALSNLENSYKSLMIELEKVAYNKLADNYKQ